MRQKVLIVDDAAPIHSLVKVRLQAEPVDLFSAYDGETALTRAAELEPDVILLDIDMPDPSGFEVCRRLKADPVLAKSMVIFLTGADSSDDKIHGLNLGAVDYVTKPFDAAELRARVRGALRMKYLMDLLEKKAMVDSLTGLWNRGYLDYRLNAEISTIRRLARPLGCVLIDVDHFKSINDRFGHPFGDHVLRAIGATMTANSRAEDIVCRYGGEEFAVLTPGVDAAGAAAVADRLRQKVEAQAFDAAGQRVNVTCSAGVADLELAGVLGGPELLGTADRALYQAKLAGRNRTVVARAGGQQHPPAKAA